MSSPTKPLRNKGASYASMRSSACRVVLVHLLEKRLGVVGRVVLDDFRWIEHIDLIDEIVQLGTNLSLHLLDLLQTTRLDKGTSSLEIMWKHLCELLHNVLEDVVRRLLE